MDRPQEERCGHTVGTVPRDNVARPGLKLMALLEETGPGASRQKGLGAQTVDLVLETESSVRLPSVIVVCPAGACAHPGYEPVPPRSPV